MIGKNINEKRWLVIVSAVIIIFSGVAVGFGLQALASTRSNNLTASVGIGSDIGAAYGFNATGKNPTWEVGTLSFTPKTDSVNVTFARGFNATNVVVFEKNARYDVAGLLNDSYLFTKLNVALTTYSNKTLESASLTFGTQINDTSVHSITDKGVAESNVWSSTTIYDKTSNVNNLGTSVEMDTFGLLTSNFKNEATIEITLDSSHFTSKSTVSLKITQTFGAPFDINIIEISQVVMLLLGVVLIFGVVLGMPRRRER